MTTPTLTLKPKDATQAFLVPVRNGTQTDMTLLCELLGGTTADIRWYKDGVDVTDALVDVRRQSYEHGGTLTLSAVGDAFWHQHAGSYHCTAMVAVVDAHTGRRHTMRQTSNTYDLLVAHSAQFMGRSVASRHWPSKLTATDGAVSLPCL